MCLIRPDVWFRFWTMKTFTISDAKSHLSALVEMAERGDQVLIMRGSKPAVTLVPVDEEDLMICRPLRVSDPAAEGLMAEARTELKTGRARILDSTEDLRGMGKK